MLLDGLVNSTDSVLSSTESRSYADSTHICIGGRECGVHIHNSWLESHRECVFQFSHSISHTTFACIRGLVWYGEPRCTNTRKRP